MNIKSSLAHLAFLASLWCSVAPTAADTITYELTDDMSSVFVWNDVYGGSGGYPVGASYQLQQVFPKDVVSGDNLLPRFTLNAGDSINVTVSLDSPMAIPATDYFNITLDLMDTPLSGQKIYVDQAFSLFSNGTLLSFPVGFHPFDISEGFLGMGGSLEGADLAAFSFDKISFSALVTQLLDENGQSINALAFSPRFGVSLAADYVFQSATTPIPGAALLMLTGLGSLAGAARLRRRSQRRA